MASNQVTTETQTSAGGVAFRRAGARTEAALISTGDPARWQLPKGIIGRGESEEEAARREVREEAGVTTELLALVDKIEYWYYGTSRGRRVRFHKQVYFYLLRYVSGDVRDHDHEVNEARWVEIGEAERTLAFKNERAIIARARQMIEALPPE